MIRTDFRRVPEAETRGERFGNSAVAMDTRLQDGLREEFAKMVGKLTDQVPARMQNEFRVCLLVLTGEWEVARTGRSSR